MQGVSINILVKTGAKKNNELAEVYHYDLYGKRNDKYEFLSQNSLSSIGFKKVEYSKPYYFLYQKMIVKELVMKKVLVLLVCFQKM